MAFSFLKIRWQKTVFVIALWLITIVAALAFLINIYWSPVLADRLKTTILNSTDSLYSVSFSAASLHVIEGRIIIDNLELKPNMAVYNRRKKLHLAPNSLYTLKIKRLSIAHTHPLNLYFQKKLDIAQITINTPSLSVDYEQNRDQDTLIKDRRTPYQMISKVLKSVHVESIVLKDVKFRYTDHGGSKNDVSGFEHVNFTATDLLIDSLTQNDKTRFLFCKDINTEINNYEGTSYNKRYKYSIDNISFSTSTSQLNITGINFGPDKTVNDFFKTTPSDCFAIKLDSLQLSNFDFKMYNKYHKLYGSKLRLSNGSVHIYDNPAPNDITVDGSEGFPHVLLRKLKTDIRIDTIQINNTGIFYTEYNPKSGEDGTLSFEKTSGNFLNVTNNKTALQKNNLATANLQTYLMNAGRLNVQFTFNLTDALAPFSFKGHLGAMDLHKVNPIAMPLAMVKIASGNVKSLDFNMNADKRASKGSLMILYNDLKVSLLKKDSADHTLKKMGLASLLANALVIKRNNPDQNQKPRYYYGSYARNRNITMYTFMWRSLLAGLKSNAGYDASTENTVKQKISDFKNGQADRKAKKAIRQQRRAERRQRRALKQQEKEAKKQQEQEAQ
jgi:hypothetical protein